jgi:hypothetical protein
MDKCLSVREVKKSTLGTMFRRGTFIIILDMNAPLLFFTSITLFIAHVPSSYLFYIYKKTPID